jgi:hypothetical protein
MLAEHCHDADQGAGVEALQYGPVTVWQPPWRTGYLGVRNRRGIGGKHFPRSCREKAQEPLDVIFEPYDVSAP